MSDRLYDLRIQLGLTPSQLGEAAKVHPDTIRSIENGSQPRTKTAVALTRYFSKRLDRVVPASELFGREPEAAPDLRAVPEDIGA